MIISHKYKFIFFAVPKTATHAVRFALRPHLGNDDEEHCFLYKPSKLNIEAFKERKNGHFSVEEIKPHLSDQIWDNYFKFAFVRNPWDRFISICFFHYKAIQNNPKIADNFLLELISRPETDIPHQFRPQSRYLFDHKGDSPINYIGKFENLKADFNIICEKVGIPKTSLGQLNQSKHEIYTKYYNSVHLKEKVRDRYIDDIRNFDYKFDNFEDH